MSAGYGTIAADPPWPIRWSGGNRKAGWSSGSTRVHKKRPLPYSTMSIEDIAALPVRDIAADDAHLFLWAFDRFVLNGSAQAVARAWGFEPLPQMIVWTKANAGLGRYVRPAHELLLIGRRGNARLREAAIPSVQAWRQPYENGAKVHSAKPDGAMDAIEALSPGPYVELFSRRARLGWDVWGDQSLATAEMPVSGVSSPEGRNDA